MVFYSKRVLSGRIMGTDVKHYERVYFQSKPQRFLERNMAFFFCLNLTKDLRCQNINLIGQEFQVSTTKNIPKHHRVPTKPGRSDWKCK